MNFFKWLSNIDRRWIYLLMAVVISIPIFIRAPVKVKPSPDVTMLYDYLENQEEGMGVLLSFDYSPDSLAELQPMAKALSYHALSKNLRLMGIALSWPSAAGLGIEAIKSQVDIINSEVLKDLLDSAEQNEEVKTYAAEKKLASEGLRKEILYVLIAKLEKDKEIEERYSELKGVLEKARISSEIVTYEKEVRLIGRDWCYFGYKPGYTQMILGMGTDIATTLSTDYKGTSLLKYEMFNSPTEKMKNYDNIAVCIDLAAGGSLGSWLAFVNTKFGRPVATGVTAVMAADYYPYLQSKQIIGLLNGMRGAADYETLIGKPGRGLSGMSSQSAAHILIIIFIILGNIGYFLGKKGGEK